MARIYLLIIQLLNLYFFLKTSSKYYTLNLEIGFHIIQQIYLNFPSNSYKSNRTY